MGNLIFQTILAGFEKGSEYYRHFEFPIVHPATVNLYTISFLPMSLFRPHFSIFGSQMMLRPANDLIPSGHTDDLARRGALTGQEGEPHFPPSFPGDGRVSFQ